MPLKEKVKIVIMGDAKSAEKAFKRASNAAKVSLLAIGSAASGSAAALAKVEAAVIRTSAEFERYNTQLITIEGSSAKANRSMEWIADFTKTTPYELNQVTESFVRLRAYGVTPTDGTLLTLGDTAAAMGKPLLQAVEAMADALTGENERLKEFGIKAKVNGDQIAYNWTDASGRARTSIAENNAAMIQDTLTAIWSEKYQGGMDRLSQTWEGMTSNLSDQWTLFKKDIGDQGAFDSAKNVLTLVLTEINKNDVAVKELSKDISSGLITSMEAIVVAGSMVTKGFEACGLAIDVVRVAIDGVSFFAVDVVDVLASGLQEVYGLLANLPGEAGKVYAVVEQDAASFRASLGHIKQEIVKTGGESLTELGEDYDAFGVKVDDVASKIYSALEAGRSAANEDIESADGSVSDADPFTGEPADAIDAKLAGRLEKIETALMTEEERLEQSHINKLQIVANSIEAGLITEEAGLVMSNQLSYKYSKAKQKVEATAAKARLSLASSAMGTLSNLLSTGGAKAFAASKALSVAETVISTYSAAQKAYESQLAIPTPDAPVRAAVAAGIAVAQGAARVASIMSTNLGSSQVSANAGGASTPGGLATQSGFEAPGVPVPSVADQAPAAVHVNVSIEPGVYSSADIRNLIEGINEEIGNGVALRAA